MKRKDKWGRVWEYCDSEGTWSHDGHIIGCAGSNGRKWNVWTKHHSCDYDTLREAMLSC